MQEMFVLLNNNIKNMFRKTGFFCAAAFGIIFLQQILIIWLLIYMYLDLGDSQYHFYMNTKHSLENIHNVKIDPYDGSIARELSTEDILLRKQNSRWHLRYLFK